MLAYNSAMHFEQVSRDEMIPEYTRIWALENPEDARTAEESAAYLNAVTREGMEEHWLGMIGGRAVAAVTAYDPVGKEPLERLAFEHTIDPGHERECWPQVYSFIESVAARLGAPSWTVDLVDNQPSRLADLEAGGYRSVQRVPVTRLDIQAFDETPYLPKIDGLRSEGVVLTTIAEIQNSTPDWKRRLYDATSEIGKDIPGPHAQVSRPFETFANAIENQSIWDRNLMFVALDGEEMVGYTRVSPAQAVPGLANTGLTGTLRSHRRRGIASALKATSISALKERGFRFLQTDNDETNSMYSLNLALGFKPVWHYVLYEKAA